MSDDKKTTMSGSDKETLRITMSGYGSDKMNKNELIKLGFDESHIMCEDCGDAVATTLRGYGLGQREVCSDCNCEMGW